MNPQDKLVSAEQVGRMLKANMPKGHHLDALLEELAALPASNAWRDIAEVSAALDRMDALLDPRAELLTVPGYSMTAVASRRDMLMIRKALAIPSPANVEGDGR